MAKKTGKTTKKNLGTKSEVELAPDVDLKLEEVLVEEKVDLGFMKYSKEKILYIGKKVINGVEYNEVRTSKSTCVLTDEELKDKVSK